MSKLGVVPSTCQHVAVAEVRRPYGGVSAEVRRRQRRVLLVGGALDAVASHGVSGVTVDAVCERAGLTKRYFYESFSNLDAVLVAAMDDAFVTLTTRMTAALRVLTSPEAQARRVVEILVDSLAADVRLARLYVEAPGNAALRTRRDVAIADFTTLLLSGELGMRGGDPTERQSLAVRLVVAGTTDLVSGWLAGVIPADRDIIVETVVMAGLAAIQAA